MSYDLMVFDAATAPRDKTAFLDWYAKQTEWSEEHGYDDPAVSTPALRAWFMEMIQTYPAMNGPFAPADDHEDDEVDESSLTDYSVGKQVIYAAFAYSVADAACKHAMALAGKHGVGFFNASSDNAQACWPDELANQAASSAPPAAPKKLKKAEIDKILMQDLEPHLSAQGFRYIKSTQQWRRDQSELSPLISWYHNSRVKGSLVVVDVGMRNDLMVDLYAKATPIRPADAKFHSVIGEALWRLSGDKARGEFLVASEDDAHRAAQQIIQCLDADAMPWFAGLQKIADIDTLLNTEPNSPAARRAILDNYHRSAYGLAAARLVNNPRYDELVSIYRALLTEFSDGFYLPALDRLIELLRDVGKT